MTDTVQPSPAIRPVVRRLWTLQHPAFMRHADAEGRIVGDEDRVPASWRKAYRWLADRVFAGNGVVLPSAPIWAWPVDLPDGWHVDDVGRALLSDHERREGRRLIVFSAPSALAIPSVYPVWNEVLDHFLLMEADAVDDAMERRLWDTASASPYGALIQYTLPWLDPTWVERIDVFPATD